MELKQILEELNKEYNNYSNMRTVSFFHEYKDIANVYLSVLKGKEKISYITALKVIAMKDKQCRINAIIYEYVDVNYLSLNDLCNLSDDNKNEILEESSDYSKFCELHNSLLVDLETELQKAIEEGKQEAPERQEAPDKPQEQAKEAPKGKATAKVKGRSKTDILRIYQAMERAGFIEEFPTYERLIELHFEGDETNDISGLLSSKAGTERVQSTAKYHKFIMALITMAFNNENIKHLDKLRNEIDDYIDKLETTYSKHS